MKYKEKVISNLDSVANQLSSLKNMIENNNLTKELLLSEMSKLIKRVEDISEMVSLEDADFSNLRHGV
jgi:archaellum component FlaC